MSTLLRPAATKPAVMPRPQSGTDFRLLCSNSGIFIYQWALIVYFICQLSKYSSTYSAKTCKFIHICRPNHVNGMTIFKFWEIFIFNITNGINLYFMHRIFLFYHFFISYLGQDNKV